MMPFPEIVTAGLLGIEYLGLYFKTLIFCCSSIVVCPYCLLLWLFVTYIFVVCSRRVFIANVYYHFISTAAYSTFNLPKVNARYDISDL